jgi:hypothetical protein
LKSLYSRNISWYSQGIASTAPANSLPNFILSIVQACWRRRLDPLSDCCRGLAACSPIQNENQFGRKELKTTKTPTLVAGCNFFLQHLPTVTMLQTPHNQSFSMTTRHIRKIQ